MTNDKVLIGFLELVQVVVDEEGQVCVGRANVLKEGRVHELSKFLNALKR